MEWKRLHADKTQFIWVGPPQIGLRTGENKQDIPFRVGGVDVFPLDAVRDLGVILDSKLTMKNHVDSVVYVAVSTKSTASVHPSIVDA